MQNTESQHDKMKSVRVSQSSRCDARWQPGEIESVIEEYERIKEEKRVIDRRLADEFGKARFTKERVRCFRDGGASLWASRESVLLAERSAVVQEKQLLEVRLSSIKSRYKEACRAVASQTDSATGAKWETLHELREIKALLAQLVEIATSNTRT